MSKRQSNKQIAAQEEAAASQQAAYDQGVVDAQASPATEPAPAGDDTMTQLEKLGDMKTQGLLSDDEFAAAKAKLLGS